MLDFRFPDVPLEFVGEHAAGIMAESPISYIREAKLRGTLFDAEDDTGLVCGVDSSYFVDRNEALTCLNLFNGYPKGSRNEWPLGDLPVGHEFLFLFEYELLAD